MTLWGVAYASRSISWILVMVPIHLAERKVTGPFRPGVAILDARKFHCLHPWFPSGDSLCKAYLRDDPNLPDWLHRFHKKIMKTFVLFFFSVKLIVL